MTTFDVETSVDLGPKLRPNKEGFAPAWRTQGIIEALEPYDDSVTLVQTFSERNMLAEACTMAFFKHYPLVLSPDVIWLAIMQGFAKHVDANAEKLRSQFVDFEGKKELIVRRDNFVKGSPDNDWAGVFPEFCSQIGSFVGEPLVQTMEADFTTTTPGSKVASQITIMDTVKHYFKYTMMCGCGIPSITLKGTAEDWIKVREKAIQLKRFDLDWWLSELLPVLDQFVAAAEGKADRDFWRSVVNVHGGSGMVTGPMTGWMQVFFPYLNNSGKSNARALGAYKESYRAKINVTNWKGGFSNGIGSQVEMKSIPPSLSKAPFTYKDLRTGKDHAMLFMSGITGVIQHQDTLALEPVITWAVLEVDPDIQAAQERETEAAKESMFYW
eukprot:TRINITY_DN11492_c6_g3_i1.p1 TRINITY_DN11492_c6_g3~~TRINITY_DN11492_c6_g3_i1.p1  ORF type:complete len:384 (+),score=111.88 TRINITY_DN11492_c6_g3_i1:67-1218(+)